MIHSRRSFLRTGSAALIASAVAAPHCLSAASEKSKYSRQRPIGFSLYGMKSVPVLDALDECARIGYNNVEICVMKDFPTELGKFTPAVRRAVRERAQAKGLDLSSILIQANLSSAGKATEAVEAIKQSGQAAHDLNDRNPPLLESIIGGKTEEWEQVKAVYVDRLRAWGDAAKSVGVLVAVKAHYGQAVNSPERLLWLYQQVKHPNIVLTYDFSHFYAEGFELEPSLRQIIPYTKFIHMKDMTRGESPHYLLPGDGKTDYVAYFRLLKQVKYQGPILVEVSAHIHREPGYQPIPTAEKCYATLSRARDAAYGS